MTDHDSHRLRNRASLLKALAHPSRLLIIEMLEAQTRTVGELRDAIGSDLTTVSKHLAVLKRVGLVLDHKEGTYSHYRLTCSCVSHLIDCLEAGSQLGDDAGQH